MNAFKHLWQQCKDELAQIDREYQLQRDKLLFAIEKLEKAISEATPRRRGRGRSGHSIADLAEKVLDSRPEGMFVPALLAEVKKLGYMTESKNAANTLNTALNREKDRFLRVGDRWILKKHLPSGQVVEQIVRKTAVELEVSDVAPLPAFLMKILADGKERTTEELAREAVALGWNFEDKNPNRVVHFGLLNAVKRKLVEFHDGIWRNCAQAERLGATNGHASHKTAETEPSPEDDPPF
jgi:hypothetical protein